MWYFHIWLGMFSLKSWCLSRYLRKGKYELAMWCPKECVFWIEIHFASANALDVGMGCVSPWSKWGRRREIRAKATEAVRSLILPGCSYSVCGLGRGDNALIYIFKASFLRRRALLGGSGVKNLPANAGMAIHFSILAWRIPMDREAWWATVLGVAKSQTRLKWLSTHNAGDTGEEGSRRFPWRRKWQITLVFLHGKSRGQRRLVDCCPLWSQRVGHNWSAGLGHAFRERVWGFRLRMNLWSLKLFIRPRL